MDEQEASLFQMIEDLKKLSKHFISFSAHVAHYNRSYYENLIAQGFTEEQALELTLCHGMNLLGKIGGES